MYRVRTTWENSKSQLGAYTILANAVKKADENRGYSVFDEGGVLIHKSGQCDIVRTMAYKAKVKKKFGKYAVGKTITVTRDRKKHWVVVSDGTIIPDKSCIDLKKQIYDPDYKYPKEVAEKWVNSEGFSSATGYLFWANKYGQIVYIFKGSKGKWSLIKNYRCGTGSIADGDGGDPGLYFNAKIYDKHKTYPATHGGTLKWFMHYSSPGGNGIHYGTVGKPSTHGCIALASSPVRWVYDNLPLNTKVILY